MGRVLIVNKFSVFHWILGQTEIATIVFQVVEPLTDMHFSIFNPLGFDDVFDIGKPEITLLSNFNCNDRSLDEVDFIMHILFWSLSKIKAITQNQLLSELTIGK